MSIVAAIAGRELKAYFGTPIAYVFVVIFVMLTGVFTFQVGQFFDRAIADLVPFFTYLPWLFLILVPAVSMRLWAEERKSGTIELLMTMPITVGEAVVGKWLAGLIFLTIAMAATIPLWITVNILGQPDNGVIAISYLASIAIGGVYLAIGECMSALTRNQVIAFVIAVFACFLILTAGSPLVLDAVRPVFPEAVVMAFSSLSALNHFQGAMRGAVTLADLVWAVSMTAFWLFATAVTVNMTKAD